ncbi:MAG: hypothetical protein O3B65_06350 [Chloroflexi bacterium]|nr:hypothetical protein [Chloroflexota bacterium]
MRPGIVFVGLLAILLLTYALLRDSLGTLPTFLLQFGIVVAVLGGATWYRYSKHRKGWFFFGEDNDDSEKSDTDHRPQDGSSSDSEVRKSS